MSREDSFGFHTMVKMERLKEMAEEMDLRLGASNYGANGLDMIGIYPIKLEDGNYSWPIYNKDVTIYTGDSCETFAFLAGMRWMKDYLKMLKVIDQDDKKIRRKEQDIRNKLLMDRLKTKEKQPQ